MNLRQRIASWLAPERRGLSSSAYWPGFGAVAASGETVTPRNAEGVAAVHRCVDLIAGTVASLPLHVYRKNADGSRERAADHPLSLVLHDQPNEWQNASEWREQAMAHVLLRGNHYSERIYDRDGRLQALIPLHPDRVQVLRTDAGRVVYEVADERGQRRRLTQDQVFHLRGRSDDGLVGRSPIDTARDAIGLAIAQNKTAGNVMQRAVRPAAVIEMPHRLTDDGIERLRTVFERVYGGGAKFGGIVPLDVGMQFKPIPLRADDVALIESCKFSVLEICRLFGVPPVLAGAQEDANYSGTIALSLHFVQYTLRRHLVMWESAIRTQLLSGEARRDHYAEHSLDGLLRGDPKARADVFHLGLADGWLTVNEVRRLENLPPVPGGDVPAPRTLPGPQGLLTGEQPAPSRGT
jgi:HK97 family phage portal protein